MIPSHDPSVNPEAARRITAVCAKVAIMAQAAPLSSSEDAYIAQERLAPTKSELIHGVIVAMAGASVKHNLIASNISGELRSQLRDRPCIVLGSDQRLCVEATGLYTYADVTVVCGPAKFHAKFSDTLINPKLIVEVLSKSTEGYDRGAKFAHYRRIPSLAEYVLVSQIARRVEHHRRLETAQWVLTEFEGEAVVELPSLEAVLKLSEVYAKTDTLATDQDSSGAPGSQDPR